MCGPGCTPSPGKRVGGAAGIAAMDTMGVGASALHPRADRPRRISIVYAAALSIWDRKHGACTPVITNSMGRARGVIRLPADSEFHQDLQFSCWWPLGTRRTAWRPGQGGSASCSKTGDPGTTPCCLRLTMCETMGVAGVVERRMRPATVTVTTPVGDAAVSAERSTIVDEHERRDNGCDSPRPDHVPRRRQLLPALQCGSVHRRPCARGPRPPSKAQEK